MGSVSNPNDMTRRSLLKSAAVMASSAVLTSSLPLAASSLLKPCSSEGQSPAPANNPRWYGFNLLEYFSTDPDWMKYFPYKNDGMFQEDDFRWMRDWGFNWVRLPMDYRFWTGSDLSTIHEKQI
jgi:aryl-phospho-beta-D-glucosidase BglC (GH1 family)